MVRVKNQLKRSQTTLLTQELSLTSTVGPMEVPIIIPMSVPGGLQHTRVMPPGLINCVVLKLFVTDKITSRQ